MEEKIFSSFDHARCIAIYNKIVNLINSEITSELRTKESLDSGSNPHNYTAALLMTLSSLFASTIQKEAKEEPECLVELKSVVENVLSEMGFRRDNAILDS